ncbi:FG-GAP repeat domain-containing protein [Pelagicoccus mobilis]|uniref:VCBS repeat-containing protein n=1 Tax=Pelagicoccus mobilis TaxID=415221 RepID=A0A934RXB3_9BACT|nr:VCBS repeat-containing protein [Pelagicoccus mobilis]MBK1878261.1 VCBS repeat-containing protein [Pelagicoccus mobilis]
MKKLILPALAISTLSASAAGDAPLPIDQWTYIQIDNKKAMWGDFAKPNWLRYFGLDMGDIDQDGDADIITGRNVYLNPGDDMSSQWRKLDLGKNVDAMLFYQENDQSPPRLIAEALPDVWEFEYKKGSFKSRVIGQIPATGHHNGQGYRVADITGNGTNEILLASLGGIFMLELGPDGMTTSKAIGKDASDEGFAVGDIDGDGDLDLASGFRVEGKDPENPLVVVWFENPGSSSENWTKHEVGLTTHAVDRVEIGDLNGDGKADIAVAEERYPGLEPDASLWVFLQGEKRWDRKKIVTQYSMNNLDTADMDNDGDLDLITCEHKGSKLELQIWENDGSANFTKTLVDQGKESHLGAQTADMDGDGDLDIVSIGWDQHKFVHLWRNDAK